MTEEEFDKVIKEACELYIKNEVEKFQAFENEGEHEFSDNFKVKMNRIFRERVGGKYIPHPEVDTQWERVRSYWVRKCLIVQHKVKKAIIK